MKRRVSVLLMTSKSEQIYNFAPPLGLYRLKNCLEKHGVRCEILDFDITREESYLQKASEGYYDIIGMSLSHINMSSDLDTILKFRKASEKTGKGTIIIGGGQEATLNYRQWLESGLIDIIFLGYAEESLKDFCLSLAESSMFNRDVYIDIREKVNGVAFINQECEVVYKPCPQLTSEEFRKGALDAILEMHMPYEYYWEKVRNDRVNVFTHSEFVFETVRLYTTSHCPRRCGFCSSQNFILSSQQKPSRIIMLSAEDVYQLIEDCVHKYKARGFLFSDDDFPVGNQEGFERIRKLCHMIIDAKKKNKIPSNLKLFCQSRVADYLKNKEVRQDILDLMKNAGFDNMGLGVETFSERLLKVPSINKVGVTVKDCLAVLDVMLIKKIVPIIFIIVGIPESTIDELVDTVYIAADYIRKGADVSVTVRLRVNPGSPLCAAGIYDVKQTTWVNSNTKKKVIIEDYFIPNDPVLSGIIDKIDSATTAELSDIKNKLRWNKPLIPKTLYGMATFIATAKLIGRQDVAYDLTKMTYEMLSQEQHHILR